MPRFDCGGEFEVCVFVREVCRVEECCDELVEKGGFADAGLAVNCVDEALDAVSVVGIRRFENAVEIRSWGEVCGLR